MTRSPTLATTVPTPTPICKHPGHVTSGSPKRNQFLAKANEADVE